MKSKYVSLDFVEEHPVKEFNKIKRLQQLDSHNKKLNKDVDSIKNKLFKERELKLKKRKVPKITGIRV